MPVDEFMEQVEGCLLWEQEKRRNTVENALDWLSWFSANIMVSTGNFKKGTDPLQIKKGLYQTEADREQESEKSVEKDFETGKAKLMERFGLIDN